MPNSRTPRFPIQQERLEPEKKKPTKKRTKPVKQSPSKPKKESVASPKKINKRDSDEYQQVSAFLNWDIYRKLRTAVKAKRRANEINDVGDLLELALEKYFKSESL